MVAMPATSVPPAISQARYVSLVTFRKDGTGVPTPLWAVEAGGRLLIWTNKDTWKVKRLRNNPKVTVTPCDVRGLVGDEAVTVEGTGVLIEDAAGLKDLRAAMQGKYGWQFFVTDRFGALFRLGKRPHAGIAVTFPAPQAGTAP